MAAGETKGSGKVPTTRELMSQQPYMVGALVFDILKAFPIKEGLETITDINAAKTNADHWKNAAYGEAAAALTEAAKYRAFTPEELILNAKLSSMGFNWDLADRAMRNAAAGYALRGANQVGQARLRMMDTFYGKDAQLDALTSVRDRYMIIAKAHRYWNAYFAPELPSSSDLFVMEKKGLCTKADVIRALKEYDGLSDAWAEKTYQHYDYDPASREILRIMQLTNAPLSWARKKFKALGFNDEDLGYAVEMIANQTVETERNALQSALISDRVWGNMSEATFKIKLAQLALRTEEIDVLVSVANTKRSYNLINMQRDTQVYLYRKDQFNANELYRRLWEDVLIETDVANAITSLEAAKKGIEWVAP